MQITQAQLQNIIAFLQLGKFNVTSDEAVILANLRQELIKILEDNQKSETKSEEK